MKKLWEGIGMMAVFAAAAMAMLLIVKEKKVDGYYLSHGTNGARNVSACVYSHWTWHVDELAFCTDDYSKALDFAARANATIR